MTQDEMRNRYEYLYNKMRTSKDITKMRIFGAAEKNVFRKLTSRDPALAKEWLDSIESICWNNYLSEQQAQMLASNLVNQDGSKGAYWGMDKFFSKVSELGGVIEQEPYYNRYALWMIANAHFSDYAKSTAEDMGYKSITEVPAEKMALSMYKKAIESLKDIDRPNYIERYYFMELVDM
jgi:hypothetical protein